MEADELQRLAHDAAWGALGSTAPQSAVPPVVLPPVFAGHADTCPDEIARLDAAVATLELRNPALSARHGLTRSQIAMLAALSAAAIALGFLSPATAMASAHGLFAVAFAAVLAVRLVAIVQSLAPPECAEKAPAPIDDASLPVYTVIVALYREAEVVPQLIEALTALDYPQARLDIILALEAGDDATLGALLATMLPDHMRIVVTPAGDPRTKPRALCYALTFARGDYVVVYDAEDQPEPDQLRAAYAAFAAGPPDIGCVQARLNVYNRRENWLTTQFAIEYTALFDAILSAYVRLGIPVPLGGTSNHFPHGVLKGCGGWDPYNVTEDADVGIRLARFGYKVVILSSTTWEEAPPRARDWVAQRTRWQKGWLQTYFVHMRDPGLLWRDLGPRSWIWFQIVVGGGLLASLLNPWLYVWIAWHGLNGDVALPRGGTISQILWWAAVANMAAACVATITLALITIHKRGFKGLAWHGLTTPLYWLPISLAAYRALWEWMRAPHYWAKTPHRPRTASSRPLST